MKKFAIVFALILSMACYAEPPVDDTPPIPTPHGQVNEPISLSELLSGLSGPRPLPIVKGPKTMPTILLEQDIDEDAVNGLSRAFDELAKSRPKEVRIIISSNGGDTDSGLAMIKLIERYPANVTCVADGDVASSALAVFESCDRRVMTVRANLMAHQVAAHIEGTLTADDLRSAANSVDATNRQMMQITFAKSKVKPAEVAEKTKNHDQWWISPQEAVTNGMADVVIPKVTW